MSPHPTPSSSSTTVQELFNKTVRGVTRDFRATASSYAIASIAARPTPSFSATSFASTSTCPTGYLLRSSPRHTTNACSSPYRSPASNIHVRHYSNSPPDNNMKGPTSRVRINLGQLIVYGFAALGVISMVIFVSGALITVLLVSASLVRRKSRIVNHANHRINILPK